MDTRAHYYKNCKYCGRTYDIYRVKSSTGITTESGWREWYCSEKCYRDANRSFSGSSDSLLGGAIDVAVVGLSLLFRSGKPKPSASESGYSSDGSQVITAAERERLEKEQEQRRRELEEWSEQQREIWKDRKPLTLSDYTMSSGYREIPFTLEAYHKEIDDIFNVGAKEIADNFTRNNKPNIEAKNEIIKTKILSELEKYREEQKEKLRSYFEILNSGRNIEKSKIKLTLNDFQRKASDLNYEASDKANGRISPNFIGKKHKKIVRAAICVPVSILFFFMIYIFRNIGIVWGSIIAFAILVESFAITGDSDDWGNRISQIIFLPILGGIGGLIVGGVAWILSYFWTFVTVTWAIVMIIVNAILIFALDDV